VKAHFARVFRSVDRQAVQRAALAGDHVTHAAFQARFDGAFAVQREHDAVHRCDLELRNQVGLQVIHALRIASARDETMTSGRSIGENGAPRRIPRR